ncbi:MULTISPECIES: DUF3460 family protein [Comamonas]|jgi:hypothetical protein|uniref:DUF3460 family protein n=1 Tax=Comamonas TaxID=283 RepID=UPI0015824ADF|nr:MULTISPECIES: DUF3460 family protein [Comamonas]QXW17733.1 DUF3460 family protein [Comamonas aquatica]
MSIFARPHYTSDATDFINQMKKDNPQLEAQQLAGRALLWDKQVNYEVQADSEQARVAQQPYVYQSNH